MECLHRTWTEIDTNAIVHNCRIVKEKCNKDIYAVVKADAYGHGALRVARALCRANAVLGFAVSNITEAEELRKGGIDLAILVLGYTPVDAVNKLCDMNVTQCIYSPEYASALNSAAVAEGKRIKAHLKLDTGMGRLGFDCRKDSLDGINGAINALSLPCLDFEGVFTHFSVADSEDTCDKEFTEAQYRRFVSAVKILEQNGASFKIKHCGNSAACLSLDMPETNAVRAGIVLYGLSPDKGFPTHCDLRRAMRFTSVVSEVKDIDAGTAVSYGRAYISEGKRRIATVAAGYADGVPRLLSGCGAVMIHGKKAPIVGRVCMDQLCVDVTDIGNVSIGDEAELFGDHISVEEIAEQAQTISYEIICGISKRVPRIYKK